MKYSTSIKKSVAKKSFEAHTQKIKYLNMLKLETLKAGIKNVTYFFISTLL